MSTNGERLERSEIAQMTTGANGDRAIIIVGAGLLLVPTIRIAKQMGLKTIVTDQSEDAPGFKYADIPLVISTKDVPAHIEMAKEMSKKHNVVGVFTAGADVEVTVANVAHALGLPGVTPDVAEKCNNKVLTRRILEEAGIKGPVFQEVLSYEEAAEFAKEVGFPIMVKPLDNCASRGMMKAYGVGELELAVDNAKKYSRKEGILVEEYLEGPKQTVEMLAYNDVYHLCSIIDTHYAFDPYPVETGHNNPTRLSKETQGKLFEFAEKASRIVGINIGAAKVDTILTGKGPMVIEMTARLSGGFHCQYTTPLALGTNDIKAAIDIAIGNPLDIEDITPKFYRWSICRGLFPQPGKVREISGVEEARRIPGVAEIFLLTKEGEVIEPYTDCGKRICYIITVGDSYEKAEKSFEMAKDTIKIRTE